MYKPKRPRSPYLITQETNFTHEELELNRHGYLSQDQRDRLAELGKYYSNFARIIFATAAVVGVLPLCIWLHPFHDATAGSLVLIIGFIAGLLVAALWLRIRALNADLKWGEVSAVEGVVKLETQNDAEYGPTYAVKIGDMRFRVGERVFCTFKNGDPYRIYYAPHSKTILSAEWLRDEM
jgi:hypothetical protein